MPPTTALVKRALDQSGVPYRRDCDGDFYTVILSDDRPKEYLQCWFLLEGQTRKIFELRGLVRPPVPWQNLPEAMIQCHRYNECYRFGKLYCQPADEPKDGLILHFEGQIDVTDGVSEAFLATFIQSHLASVCEFLSKVFKDNELFKSPPPKPSRKRDSAGGKKR